MNHLLPPLGRDEVVMRWGIHLQNSVSWANLLARGMAIAGIRFDLGYPIIGLLSSCDPVRSRPIQAIKHRFMRRIPHNIKPRCKTDTSEYASLLMAL